MRLADETLAGIVARASTFRERLSNGTLIPVDGVPDTVADRRLQQWRSKAARGISACSKKSSACRSRRRNRTASTGSSTVGRSAALPDWAEWLNHALAMAGIVPDEHETPPRCIHPDDPLPYGRLLAPFVSAAASRLQARVPRIHDLLPDAAQASNERTLLRLLHGICRSALDMEFAVFRIGREDSPLSAQLQPPAADELAAFTQHMRGGGLLKFCTEYAVLARAVPLIMRNWADATSDFLDRLEADRRQIEAEFLSGKPLGAVATLEAGLSDPHNDCRMVMALSFDTGLKLLYKPKNLETEVAYSRLLEWVNGRGLSLPLKLTKVLPRDGYGWVEFIRHEDCGTDAELQRFYRRCGMLLALFQALGATDVHAENLIAHGEHPVMIDAETLITPHLDDREEPDQAEYGTWAEVRAGRMVRRRWCESGCFPGTGWPRVLAPIPPD